MSRKRPILSRTFPTTSRTRSFVGALICVGFLLLSGAAWAQTPCSGLSEADAAKYVDLNNQMVTNYKAKKWPDTVKAILALRQVCDEDPTIIYNLARAYHKAENCNKALYWYEAIQNYDDQRFAELVTELRNEAAIKVAELQMECSTSARVSVSCTDQDVWVTLGEEQARPCPFDERLEAGSYKLLAVKQGLENYEINVTLKAGENNSLIVPALSALSAGDDGGTLKISCPDDVQTFAFEGPSGIEEVPCPFERALPAGTYKVGYAGAAPSEPVVLGAGKTVDLQLSEVGMQSSPKIGILFGLRALPGLGMGDGALYEPDYGQPYANTDGNQFSGLTFGIVVEGGYAINDLVGVLVQGRIDVVNVAAIIGAVARITPWQNEMLAFRVDVGGGYGELLLPMVNADDENNIKTLLIGPAYGNLGVSLAIDVADAVAVVVETGARAGFPDFGVQIDSGVGIELKF